MNLFTRVGLALPKHVPLRSHTHSVSLGSGVTTMKKLGWQPGSRQSHRMDVSTSVRRFEYALPCFARQTCDEKDRSGGAKAVRIVDGPKGTAVTFEM